MQDSDTSACSPDAVCSTSGLNGPDGCPSCSASGIPTVARSLPGIGLACPASGMSVKLLPTPTVGDSRSAANATAGRLNPDSKHHDGVTLTDAMRLLPTPKATNNENRQSLDRYGENLGMALESLRLLPTPRSTRGGSQTETLYALGAERTDASRPQGEVLLPTPTARDGKGGNTPQDQLQDVVDRMNLALISSSAGSPASPSVMPVSVKLNLMIAGCGLKWRESFAHYDPDLSLWRTSQASLLPDSDSSSVTWPKRGTTRNGCAYELPMSALLTDASGCSSSPLLPTPQAFDATGINRSEEARARALTKGGCSNLREIVQLLPTPNTRDHHAQGSTHNPLAHSTALSTLVQHKLLPTPRTTDSHGAGEHGQGGQDLRTTVQTLRGEPTNPLSEGGNP